MTRIQSSPLLRRVLAADAIVSGATGALAVFGAGALAPLTGLSVGFLQAAGLSLIPFVVFVGWLATQKRAFKMLVTLAIVLNLAWVVESLVLPLGGWIAPTAFGHVFIGAQALAVLAFAGLQWMGLKRSAATA